MNQWSLRRKRIILAIVVLILLVFIGIPTFFLFYKDSTCFDSKQNGDETGVDCGGSCQLLCTIESLPLILKGDPRVLNVTGNIFEVVALVENPNTSGEIYRAKYIFKLYDASSVIPIKIIEGETYVPKSTTFAVFEGPFSIETGIVPTRATFEWIQESIVWQRNTLKTPELVVTSFNISRESISPRLDANIENISLENISNIDLVALISDDTNNIFAASKTFINTLPTGERVPVVFTWPRPFDRKVLDVNIIIRVFPDRSFIR